LAAKISQEERTENETTVMVEHHSTLSHKSSTVDNIRSRFWDHTVQFLFPESVNMSQASKFTGNSSVFLHIYSEEIEKGLHRQKVLFPDQTVW